MEFVELEQEQYNKLKILISNNLFNEAKEYAYELLKIKSKDLICYLYLVKVYSNLNKPLKVQNLIQKIKGEISYFKIRQTKYYKKPTYKV